MSDQDYQKYLAALATQNISHTAYLEQNANLCSPLTGDTLYQCYNGVALASLNVSVCDKIPANSGSYENNRNFCIGRVAQKANNPSMCEKIINDSNENINNCKSLVKGAN